MGLGMVLALLLVAATPALAGVGGSVFPNYPLTVTTGDTGVAASITIMNVSTIPNDTESVSVQQIRHTPSCGSLPLGSCPSGFEDPGVFLISAAAGRAGTACAGVTFAVSEINAATGEVAFTPSVAVSLGPSIGAPATSTCTIDFAVDVLKVPAKDANGAATGIQTDGVASAVIHGESSGLDGSGTGTSQVTVNSLETQITDLIALINSFNLQQGLTNNLISRLDAVLAACRELGDFILQVQAQSGKKLSAAQATQLIAGANQIKATLACP